MANPNPEELMTRVNRLAAAPGQSAVSVDSPLKFESDADRVAFANHLGEAIPTNSDVVRRVAVPAALDGEGRLGDIAWDTTWLYTYQGDGVMHAWSRTSLIVAAAKSLIYYDGAGNPAVLANAMTDDGKIAAAVVEGAGGGGAPAAGAFTEQVINYPGRGSVPAPITWKFTDGDFSGNLFEIRNSGDWTMLRVTGQGDLFMAADNIMLGNDGVVRASSFRCGGAGGYGPSFSSGTGSPEGMVYGSIGSIYAQTDAGDANVLWKKTGGDGNSGWVLIGA